jgi:putative CocE/NonD family hydrolase
MRVFDALAGHGLRGRHAPVADYTITRDIPIATRDGITLLADHLAPTGVSRGTLLLRGPYGFSGPMMSSIGGVYALRGYHVVLARCRGTFGSGGQFDPMVNEVNDAADTVAWLREQPWFTGRFATIGQSYLGFTQWALLMDPPPELATAVIQVAPHDFSRVAYLGGAFTLHDFLTWTDLVTHQEGSNALRQLPGMITETRRVGGALRSLPIARAAEPLCGDRATWFEGWVSHRDLDDPFWKPMQLRAALDRVQVPVLLQTGWQDIFLQQTLGHYEYLRDRGVDVALTVGPWTHYGFAFRGGTVAVPESLDWFAEHLANSGPRVRTSPVRTFITGAKQWQDLPTWPPPVKTWTLYPRADGSLAEVTVDSTVSSGPRSFTYDPNDPTPTVGGRVMSRVYGGYKNDTALAKRPDVLTFTGQPLTRSVLAAGTPVIELDHHTDNPHVDLFVRISEVNAKGKSRNVSDGFLRLSPEQSNGVVRIEMDPINHRFAAGSQIRLMVAGGSFPHWERQLGTDEDPALGTTMRASRRTINLSGTRLELPTQQANG